MSSRPDSTTPSGDSDTHFDLENLFRHPAGLRTARYIVRSYLEASAQRSARNTGAPTGPGDFSSVSPSMYDSSSDPRDILSNILAFREAEGSTSEQRMTAPKQESSDSREGSRRDGMAKILDDVQHDSSWDHSRTNTGNIALRALTTMVERSEELSNCYTNRSSANLMQTTLSNTSSRLIHISSTEALRPEPGPSLRPQYRLLENLANREMTSSLSGADMPVHGTESPYTVESPSGQIQSSVSSRNSPQRNGMQPPLSSDNYNLDKDPLHLDRLSSWNPSSATTSKTTDIGRSTLSRELSNEPTRLSSTVSHHSTHPDSTAKPAPMIKSFLPVNKSLRDNGDPTIGTSIFGHNSLSEVPALYRKGLASPSDDIKPTNSNINFLQSQSSSSITSFSASSISQPITQHSSFSGDSGREWSALDMAPEKRKQRSEGQQPRAKKRKGEQVTKPKRAPKVKAPKPEPAKYRLTQDLWMRILEFTPPAFMKKARLFNKEFKNWVDTFDSLYINQRIELYGKEMPGPICGLTQRQYNDLLGGKGCLAPGCTDDKASRTHWSWAKRWCWNCWKEKIEREDRVLKIHQNEHGRPTMIKLLECIPVGMHDSFMKPHDFEDDLESRARGSPRLYKYYLKEDVERIIAAYKALTPPPYKENPKHTDEQKAEAKAAHQKLMSTLDERRDEFFTREKKDNDDHMKRVQLIEQKVKQRREVNAIPYNNNRASRKELFSRRAMEELPHIPTEFVQQTKAFKAATRIFRDGGTERGWQTLKPKIEKEYEDMQLKGTKTGTEGTAGAEEEVDEDDLGEDDGLRVSNRMDAKPSDSPLPIARPNSLTQHFQLAQMQHAHQMQHNQEQIQRAMFPQQHRMLNSTMSSLGGMGPTAGYGSMMASRQPSFTNSMNRTFPSFDSLGGGSNSANPNLFPQHFASNYQQTYVNQANASSSNAYHHMLSGQQPSRITIKSLLHEPQAPAKPPSEHPTYNPYRR